MRRCADGSLGRERRGGKRPRSRGHVLRQPDGLARNLPIIAYSPLLGGAYSPGGKPLPPEYAGADSAARLAALQSVAAEKGATPNQIVLAWMLQSVPPVVPLVGAGTAAQLVENLGALDIVLSGEDMDRLS